MGDAGIWQKKLQIHKYSDAFAVPTGNMIHVFDNQGTFVPYTSKRKVGKAEYAKVDTQLDVEEIDVDYCDEDVVYIGFMRGHYGHFLVDSAVRLWALCEEECAGKKLLITFEEVTPFIIELFDYLEVDKTRFLLPKRPTRFRSILVPELSYFPCTYIAEEYLSPFNEVVKKVNLDKPIYDKLYLSRIHFSQGKRELGEKDIQDIFEKNGYKVLYPEELSFQEQVWYYKNCKTIVTTNGTIAHNILFAPDRTELIILNRFNKWENTHQRAINLIKNIRDRYVNVYVEGSDRDNSLMWRTEDFLKFCEEKSMSIPRQSIFRKVFLQLIFRLPLLYRWCK